jgi:dephospho-CoA kinase
MLVLVVVGLARSGKDAAAEYIKKKYKFGKFGFSDLIAEELKKSKIPATKENLMKKGDELRKDDQGILGKIMAKKIKNRKKVVLVGARSPEEIAYVRKAADKLFVIKIEAKNEKRFSRKSDADPQESFRFFARDKIDIEKKGLQKVLDNADFAVENNGTLEQLYGKIDAIMKKITC